MSRRFRVLSCAALLGLIVGALAGPAAAQNQPDQSQPDLQEARNHYAKAEQAMKQGDFAVAADEYGKAYEITKDPILFYKIAGAHYEAGNCEQAVANYTRYLDEEKPGEPLRARTQERIDACKSAPAGDATAAGQDSGAGPTGGTGARNQATNDQATDNQATGKQTAGKQAANDQAGGASGNAVATDTDNAASEEAQGAAGLPGGDRPPSFADQEVSWRSQTAWVSVGLVATFVTAGAVLGLSASSREEDLANLINFRYPNGEPAVYAGTTRARYEDYVDEGERLAGYSKLAFGAAGLAAISATVFFIMDARAGKESAPTSAEIAPLATPDTLGMAAGWQF